MADALYIGMIQDGDSYLRVTADTGTGVVRLDSGEVDAPGMELSSTDAHYLAALLRTAVDMIDFRAQLDAHR